MYACTVTVASASQTSSIFGQVRRRDAIATEQLICCSLVFYTWNNISSTLMFSLQPVICVIIVNVLVLCDAIFVFNSDTFVTVD